ncbi:MAG TPA: ABC transporter permease subunit [Chloroflexota bacterium]|nr:ABC transporter permease subunit [Chloroflexota bacterium]
MSWAAVRALVGKELRQLRRSRGAVVSSALLPILLMIIVPLGQLAGFSAAGDASGLSTANASNPANAAILARFERPIGLFTDLLLPLFVAMTGVVVPSVATAYAVVAERERRSIDLLMALPVSVTEVLVAKVLTVFLLALGVTLPLFVIQSTALLIAGVTDVGRVLALLLVLLGSFTCSVGVTFVITILARDYRTANNLSGLQIGPVVLMTPLLLLLLPGPPGFVLLAALLAALGLVALFIAWRWITFERYLA